MACPRRYCTGQIRIISVAVEDRGSATSAVVQERRHDQPEEFSGELFSCSGPVHCLLLLGTRKSAAAQSIVATGRMRGHIKLVGGCTSYREVVVVVKHSPNTWYLGYLGFGCTKCSGGGKTLTGLSPLLEPNTQITALGSHLPAETSHHTHFPVLRGNSRKRRPGLVPVLF